MNIRKQDVVTGDVVKLESGDEIPADGYLIESKSLCVDESNFTGELYANKTTVEADFDPDATYASDFLLRGSTVIEGNAVYRVSAVGMLTEEDAIRRGAVGPMMRASGIKVDMRKTGYAAYDDIDFEHLNAKILHLGYFLLLEKVDQGDGLAILKRAKELGLKEAEYGDEGQFSYCYWNQSGDRNDSEQVIAYYKFDGNKLCILYYDQ